ncbi:MAG: DUF2510 domain-containing protein [Sporichthyaceae bacterium]
MTTQAPAGWYPDNANPSQLRFWDGMAWTEQVALRTAAVPATRAAPPPPPPSDSSGGVFDLPSRLTERSTRRQTESMRRQAEEMRQQAEMRREMRRIHREQWRASPASSIWERTRKDDPPKAEGWYRDAGTGGTKHWDGLRWSGTHGRAAGDSRRQPPNGG